MKKLLLVLSLFFLSLPSFSQNNFTIMCVAAHPDDEDGATLAYYSKIKGYKAYTIFYTRGEGGQNEIGPELNDQLGKIREQECYDAAAIQGSTAYFLGELDFGYSKTAKETFKMWGGEDSVLARIVYMIRVLRPDVIISNHDTITTKPDRQHGNHQAVGISVYEAFDKAADPNYHPEQLTGGITPWQVKKLFFRQNDTTKTDVFEIDVSQRDPASHKSIEEIYYDALAMHKTQGMDKTEKNFRGVRRYELIKSDKMYPLSGNDLFEGLVPDAKSDFKIDIKSYTTQYAYYQIKPDDSLKILKSVAQKTWMIGLVNTYDNTLENVFNAFNVNYNILTPHDIEKKELTSQNYQTIILDLRAYFYRPDIVKFNQKFLKYVEEGGNLIVFYNKPQDWNGFNFAPYPIFLTSERVTEENAEVTMLKPYMSIFKVPNNINENDWDGWIQERNVYLPSNDTSLTSNKYLRLLKVDDEDDPVPSTSLLFANYGKGYYIYCSLALYRQLKIFNEGALKLLMNLISQNPIDIEQSR